MLPSSFESYPGKYGPIFKVGFCSKEVFDDVLTYSSSFSTSNKCTKIPSIILTGSKDIKLEFLRAFFEDEGSISSDKRIMADSRSKTILNQILKLLEELGLTFSITSYSEEMGRMYKIYSKKSFENLKKFYDLKLFDKSIATHGVNKGQKKLDILKRYLESFKNP